MKKLQSFIFTSVLGGLTVLLPSAIIIIVFNWIFLRISALIEPLSNAVAYFLGEGRLSYVFAQGIVIAVIICLCFITGLLQRTKLGQMAFEGVEGWLKNIPGYVMVKETIAQFTGGKRSPFRAVVLVKLWDSEVQCTGFVTDDLGGDKVTVFVPTGPNPTTGGIFHLDRARITYLNVPVESAMRTIISCGAGSKQFFV